MLKRSKRPEPNAIIATDCRSMVGPVKWTGQPLKNVTKTPLVAGQWLAAPAAGTALALCRGCPHNSMREAALPNRLDRE